MFFIKTVFLYETFSTHTGTVFSMFRQEITTVKFTLHTHWLRYQYYIELITEYHPSIVVAVLIMLSCSLGRQPPGEGHDVGLVDLGDEVLVVLQQEADGLHQLALGQGRQLPRRRGHAVSHGRGRRRPG